MGLAEVTALLAELYEQGFTIRVAGERLMVSPGCRLTDVQHEAITRLKPLLMRLCTDVDGSDDIAGWDDECLYDYLVMQRTIQEIGAFNDQVAKRWKTNQRNR